MTGVQTCALPIALAAVIDHTRQGLLTSEDTVLFMHTGGLPELFNFADHF